MPVVSWSEARQPKVINNARVNMFLIDKALLHHNLLVIIPNLSFVYPGTNYWDCFHTDICYQARCSPHCIYKVFTQQGIPVWTKNYCLHTWVDIIHTISDASYSCDRLTCQPAKGQGSTGQAQRGGSRIWHKLDTAWQGRLDPPSYIWLQDFMTTKSKYPGSSWAPITAWVLGSLVWLTAD